MRSARDDMCSLRLPTFEVTGFPISMHQMAVLGSAHVEERSARATLELAGMPASPHQIAVLTPRPKTLKITEASTETGLTTAGLTAVALSTVDAGQDCVAN
jgi:hypothetical protein